MRQVFIRNSKSYWLESLQAHSRVWDNFWQLKAFKSYNKCFLFNIYFFISKPLFVLEIFMILSWLFGYTRKQLDKTSKVNFKIYDVRNWKTNNYNTHNIIIHTLSNISRSKDNQAMTFDQLIKYNVRNISFHKSYRKSGRETNSSPLFIF